MLTRALQYNNLTVHTQIKKKNYIVHFATINIEEKNETTAIYTPYNLYNYLNTTVLILLKLKYL